MSSLTPQTDLTPAEWELPVMRQFFDNLCRNLGEIPRSYVVFDVETTGVVRGTDLITQIGHAVINNGQCVATGQTLLDWTQTDVDEEWLGNRLATTRHNMEAAGKVFHMDLERMQQDGDAPNEVLQAYFDLFTRAREAGFLFVVHGGWSFDVPMLEHHFYRYLGQHFTWADNEIFDTGMLEKALQLELYPYPGDTLKSWAQRVNGQRARGVYWSLDGHCVPKYNLAQRYELDMQSAHEAEFDCYVTYLLFEEFRRMVDGG